MSFLNRFNLKKSHFCKSSELRIGITQRLEQDAHFSEWRDSLDQRWFKLLEPTGAVLLPIPNGLVNINNWLRNQKINAVIFTGGGDLNLDYIKNNRFISLKSSNSNVEMTNSREMTELVVFDYCLRNKHPMIGVCRGAQFLNVISGGNISHVPGHVSTHHSISFSKSNTFESYVSLLPENVNSYHNYGIQINDLSKDLTPIAFADGTIEAFLSLERRILGIMWHPERDKEIEHSSIKLLKYHFNFHSAS
jgi:putative glutamine amidotransferase